jgi:phage/plasmid-associated DNA primase
MINGAMHWQEQGLRPPEAVTAATRAYLEAEDALSAWLDECCTRTVSAWEPTGGLFASWRSWADKAGETGALLEPMKKTAENKGGVTCVACVDFDVITRVHHTSKWKLPSHPTPEEQLTHEN